MYNILEELYFGNLDPQARDMTQNPAMGRLSEILSQGEQYFTASLTGEERQRFLDYADAWGRFDGESCLDSFLVGFRLGARFCRDTFLSDAAPFAPLRKD